MALATSRRYRRRQTRAGLDLGETRTLKCAAERRRRLVPRTLHLVQEGSPFLIPFAFDGAGALRVDNLGPFPRGEVRRLRRWLDRVAREET